MIQILLIEDDAVCAERLRQALRGLDVLLNLVVSDGEDAMDLLRMNAQFSEALRPDLILLDLELRSHGADGILKELRSHSSLRSIPIIKITQSTNSTRGTNGGEVSTDQVVNLHQAEGYERLVASLSQFVESSNSRSNPPAA